MSLTNSFKPSFRLLASHVGRTPSIHFPDRKQRKRSHSPHPPEFPLTLLFPLKTAHHPHPATPHPSAPQSIIDNFSQFQSKQSSDGGIPLAGPAGGAAKGRGFESSLEFKGEFMAEWELPERFRRGKYAPEEEEVEAVLSGGATVAPEVTKASKEKWWTAQV